MIVVDASAMLELLLATPRGARVEARIFNPGETLHAPHLIDLEVAQVLRRYCAGKELTPDRGREALDDLAHLRLSRYPHTLLLPRVWELRQNLTAYDAAYLALAELLDAPLVTCDRALASAPGHSAQVQVI